MRAHLDHCFGGAARRWRPRGQQREAAQAWLRGAAHCDAIPNADLSPAGGVRQSSRRTSARSANRLDFGICVREFAAPRRSSQLCARSALCSDSCVIALPLALSQRRLASPGHPALRSLPRSLLPVPPLLIASALKFSAGICSHAQQHRRELALCALFATCSKNGREHRWDGPVPSVFRYSLFPSQRIEHAYLPSPKSV